MSYQDHCNTNYGPEDVPEDDALSCDCVDYDTDWEGRATCMGCGRTWYLTAEQMQYDADRADNFERYIGHERRKDFWLAPWRLLRGLFRRRDTDEIPF